MLELIKSDGKIVQMLSFKEMQNIPLSICKCGKEYCALPDTFFGGVDGLSMCTNCRIELYDKIS